MPEEKCLVHRRPTSRCEPQCSSRAEAFDYIVGNADNAFSHICRVRTQTISCQSLSAG